MIVVAAILEAAHHKEEIGNLLQDLMEEEETMQNCIYKRAVK